MANEMFQSSVGASFLYGVMIYYSPLCLETLKEPARPYKRRRWQSEAKAALKQKKWTKRWGLKQVPCMFRSEMPGNLGGDAKVAYFAHPSLKETLEGALARERIIQDYRRPFNMAYAAWRWFGVRSAEKDA